MPLSKEHWVALHVRLQVAALQAEHGRLAAELLSVFFDILGPPGASISQAVGLHQSKAWPHPMHQAEGLCLSTA